MISSRILSIPTDIISCIFNFFKTRISDFKVEEKIKDKPEFSTCVVTEYQGQKSYLIYFTWPEILGILARTEGKQ